MKQGTERSVDTLSYVKKPKIGATHAATIDVGS